MSEIILTKGGKSYENKGRTLKGRGTNIVISQTRYMKSYGVFFVPKESSQAAREGGFLVEGGVTLDNPVTHRELESFKELMESENKRLADEDDRQNHRIDILENSIQKMTDLAASTEKLAVNMENMLKVQEQQSKRLEQIESRDGNKWRKAMEDIGRIILGAVLAIVFAKIGM